MVTADIIKGVHIDTYGCPYRPYCFHYFSYIPTVPPSPSLDQPRSLALPPPEAPPADHAGLVEEVLGVEDLELG